MLSRSAKSTAGDSHKIQDLHNALNQVSRNHLIDHALPNLYLEFKEKLSVVGSQIEAVGMVKTRAYAFGQLGVFDDGTSGISGGKLLGGGSKAFVLLLSFVLSNNYQNPNVKFEPKDADGDIRMTGINKIRAKWVSKKEIDRRRLAGFFVRCGEPGHRIPTCPQLPPLRPEATVNSCHGLPRTSRLG
ncbi:hypothetical protein K3495_g7931 [Podosphaera aphanis]|nr:hypothetical protein K3495_g7931 [Podosphaera aphanis]